MAEAKPLILIVDDDETASHMLEMALLEVGYEVATAENGALGLQKGSESHPALVMLDYQMPDTDGVSVLQKMRTEAWGKDVPVIFMTNAYEVNVMNLVMELGVHDYILKSDVRIEETVKLVSSYVPAPLPAA